jgi:hypothetical protein
MKVMNVEMDRLLIEIGRDGKVPIAAVLHGSMCHNCQEKWGVLNLC